MNNLIALSFISFAIISLNSTVYAGSSDDKGQSASIPSQQNWKLHIADLEAAAYADEHDRSVLVT